MNGIVSETTIPPRMAAGGARARKRAGRDQRSGSTGRTLAASDDHARSVSFNPASRRLPSIRLFFILDEEEERFTAREWQRAR
jgi:hypothetical protein